MSAGRSSDRFTSLDQTEIPRNPLHDCYTLTCHANGGIRIVHFLEEDLDDRYNRSIPIDEFDPDSLAQLPRPAYVEFVGDLGEQHLDALAEFASPAMILSFRFNSLFFCRELLERLLSRRYMRSSLRFADSHVPLSLAVRYARNLNLAEQRLQPGSRSAPREVRGRLLAVAPSSVRRIVLPSARPRNPLAERLV